MKNFAKKNLSFLLLGLAGLSGEAAALPITFTADNLVDPFNGTIPLQDPVIAYFDYTSDSDNRLVLNSFSMQIGSKHWQLADIVFNNSSPGYLTIGGPFAGLNGGGDGIDDFFLSYNSFILTNGYFSYTSSERYGVWMDVEATAEITQAPEPGAFGLFGLSLLGLGLAKRKKLTALFSR